MSFSRRRRVPLLRRESGVWEGSGRQGDASSLSSSPFNPCSRKTERKKMFLNVLKMLLES